jgi:hypothetical protein
MATEEIRIDGGCLKLNKKLVRPGEHITFCAAEGSPACENYDGSRGPCYLKEKHYNGAAQDQKVD